MKYKAKSHIIDAIQFNGKNIEEIQAIDSGWHPIKSLVTGSAYLIHPKLGQIHPGQWLILSDRIRVIPNSDFIDLYEDVPEAHNEG